MSIKANGALVFVLAISSTLATAQDKPGKTTSGHARAPQVVSGPGAPKPSGPYSQAIKAGDFVFATGQTGRDPATDRVEGDITAQTNRALNNLAAVLSAAGTSMDRVVKTTVYLKNMSDFAKVNEIYGTYFKSNPPARTTIGVVALRSSDALVEIEMIALQ